MLRAPFINLQTNTARINPLRVACFIIFLAAFSFSTFEPNSLSLIPCFFYKLTGLPCPGCGMTKAFLCLARLEVAEALNYNVFSLPLFLCMLWYLVTGKNISLFEKPILANSLLFFIALYYLWKQTVFL